MQDRAIPYIPNQTQAILQLQQDTQQPYLHIQQSILHASQHIPRPYSPAIHPRECVQASQHKVFQLTLVTLDLTSLNRIAT